MIIVRKRLRVLKASVWIENISRPEKQRENDMGIMDAMMRIPGVNEAQLRSVNMCLIYMRVIMVSDMANVHGTVIPLGRTMGQWRRESVLSWKKLP